MNNILVATDFSNEAYNALHYATRLFEQEDCHFYVLNSYTEHWPLLSLEAAHASGRSQITQLADESKEGLEETFHKINLDHKNDLHQVTTISRNESLIESIQEAIRAFDIDLVVAASKVRRGVKLFQSSHLPALVEEIDACPVLVVPEDADTGNIKEIAFATDYKRSYDAKTLYPLRYLANLHEAKICIVHINEEENLSNTQRSNRDTLKAYLKDISHSVHWMPDFSTKREVIKCFLEELNIGMLAMIRYEHGLIPAMFREAVIKRISGQLHIPFLVMPAAN